MTKSRIKQKVKFHELTEEDKRELFKVLLSQYKDDIVAGDDSKKRFFERKEELKSMINFISALSIVIGFFVLLGAFMLGVSNAVIPLCLMVGFMGMASFKVKKFKVKIGLFKIDYEK